MDGEQGIDAQTESRATVWRSGWSQEGNQIDPILAVKKLRLSRA